MSRDKITSKHPYLKSPKSRKILVFKGDKKSNAWGLLPMRQMSASPHTSASTTT